MICILKNIKNGCKHFITSVPLFKAMVIIKKLNKDKKYKCATQQKLNSEFKLATKKLQIPFF